MKRSVKVLLLAPLTLAACGDPIPRDTAFASKDVCRSVAEDCGYSPSMGGWFPLNMAAQNSAAAVSNAASVSSSARSTAAARSGGFGATGTAIGASGA